MRKNLDPDRIIYSIAVRDVQEIAEQKIERELTPEEIRFVEDRIAAYIPWVNAINMVIDELLVR